MDSKKIKFGIGIAIIVGIVAWEGISGFQQAKSYYVTVKQLTSGKSARRDIRVGGVVTPGSIERVGTVLSFRLAQGSDSIPVTYVGDETLPDTFKGGAQAVIQGNYTAGGQFMADHIQAKCASKYQAAPPPPPPQSASVADPGTAR